MWLFQNVSNFESGSSYHEVYVKMDQYMNSFIYTSQNRQWEEGLWKERMEVRNIVLVAKITSALTNFD